VLGRVLPRLDAVGAALRKGGDDVDLLGLVVDIDLRGRLVVAVGVALREVGVRSRRSWARRRGTYRTGRSCAPRGPAARQVGRSLKKKKKNPQELAPSGRW